MGVADLVAWLAHRFQESWACVGKTTAAGPPVTTVPGKTLRRVRAGRAAIPVTVGEVHAVPTA